MDLHRYMPKEFLRVVEIIRRIPNCATEPFLCKCDDGQLYVVKGLPCVPRKQLVAEWIAAHLAKMLGLSIPDFCLVYVDSSLTQFVPEWRNALNEGHAFATKFISGVAPITFLQAHHNVGVQVQKLIYLFDRWVMNSDRSLSPAGGNVNIIYDYQNNSHYLIDHNLAFDHDDDEAFEYHVYASRHRSWIFDIVDRPYSEDQLQQALGSLSDSISELPEEWKLDDDEANQQYIDHIESTLNRYCEEDFWRSIK